MSARPSGTPDLSRHSITLIGEDGTLAHILPFEATDDRYQYMTGKPLGFSAVSDDDRRKLIAAYARALVSGRREEVVYRSNAYGGTTLHVDLFRFPPTQVSAVVLSTEVDDDADEASPRLTSREVKILALAADDKTDAEIAAAIKISVAAVATHRETICQKLGASGWVGAVAKAVREGIV
ncbi:MAG: helix-turn-helix transcriptional regulator [Planctomycetota bacterium]